MTTTETVSPRTSEPRFVDSYGNPRGTPAEWTPALLAIDGDPANLAGLRVTINGRPSVVSVRMFGGRMAVVAEWPRAGPGWYDVEVVHPDRIARHRLRIAPAKISQQAFGLMLEDLEFRLPVAIALALRDAGARVGWHHIEPAQQTIATEISRLRRAVYGTRARPGLAGVLSLIGLDPHRMLRNVGEWEKSERVRRPDPAGLVQAMWRAGNIESGLPVRVIDRRVRHDVDLYENRILRSFTSEIERHLRRIRAVVAGRYEEIAVELDGMLTAITRAERSAPFLNDVSELRTSPGRVTMVLLRRKEYRAAYEGFLEFRRRMTVQLDDPMMAEPLQNLPHLYQMWGTLLVLESVIDIAAEAEFLVHRQRLVWPQAGGLYVNVLADGRPAVEMRNSSHDRLTVTPGRSYGRSGSPLGSMSFSQIPDIAVELIRSDGSREVALFDPKYKLVSEEGADPGDGTPKKVDIDKMHAYRDAIRDKAGRRVVRFAATLYPGITKTYGEGLSAIRLQPGEETETTTRVQAAVRRLLAGE